MSSHALTMSKKYSTLQHLPDDLLLLVCEWVQDVVARDSELANLLTEVSVVKSYQICNTERLVRADACIHINSQ